MIKKQFLLATLIFALILALSGISFAGENGGTRGGKSSAGDAGSTKKFFALFAENGSTRGGKFGGVGDGAGSGK